MDFLGNLPTPDRCARVSAFFARIPQWVIFLLTNSLLISTTASASISAKWSLWFPGPGARDGLSKCFVDRGGLTESDLIRFAADRQEKEFDRLGLEFQSLWGRPLQLVDCQNLFCEITKYARIRYPQIAGISGRTRIKHRFEPSTARIPLFYPPKWGMNDEIQGKAVGLPLLHDAEVEPKAVQVLGSGSVDIDSYQREAQHTDRTGNGSGGAIVAMLGLAGESGQLLSEYKKLLRDGDTHVCFRDRLREELGDLLWYVATVASKFDLRLADVARENLSKVRARWGNPKAPRSFDAGFPEGERLPRKFVAELISIEEGGQQHVRASVNGAQFGDVLTDNSYRPDGYRFHDVFHLAYAAVLEWSPITRALLSRKRRSRPELDEVEDGGRAAAIEEGVAALVFDYGRRHEMLQGVVALDYELLRTVKRMTAHLEVGPCTTSEWEDAILQGFEVWRRVVGGQGGCVAVDLDTRRIQYLGGVSAASSRASEGEVGRS